MLVLSGQTNIQKVNLCAHAVALEGWKDPRGSQHPQCTKAAERFGLERADRRLGGQQRAGRTEVGFHAMAHLDRTFGKDLAGLTDEELIRVVQRNRKELLALQCREITSAGLSRAVADAIDAAVSTIPNLLVIIVASLLISPIGHIQSPVWTDALRDRNEPRVVTPH